MPRRLSLVAYDTPPTPASQDHSSCETFASTPLRLNSPLFPSHVGPPISSRATPRLTPSAQFVALLACESPGTAMLRSGCDCKGIGANGHHLERRVGVESYEAAKTFRREILLFEFFRLIFRRILRLKARSPPKNRSSDTVIFSPWAIFCSIKCNVQTRSAN